MKARHALAALSILILGALIWLAWPREPAADPARIAPSQAGAEHTSSAPELVEDPARNEARAPASVEEAPLPPAASPPERTLVLRGHVRDRDSRAPIEGARVSFLQYEITTGADGSFRFENLVPTSYPMIRVRAPGYADLKELVQFGDALDKEIDFELAHGDITLHVEIVDRDTGLRVDGAELNASWGAYLGERDTSGLFAVSFSEGKDAVVEAKADGYCDFSWRWKATRAGATDRVTIPLLRAAAVDVTVRDASRKPIHDAIVMIRSKSLESARDSRLSSEERMRHGLSGTASHALHSTNHKTDEQGRLRIPVVPWDGELEIVATSKPLMERKQLVRASDPGSTVAVEFTLDRGATLRGRAVKNGASYTGVVWAQCPEIEYLDTTKVESGEFELTGVPRGTIALKLMQVGEDVAEQEATVQVTDDGTYTRDFEWSEERSTIAGRVVSPAGAPVAGASVDMSGVAQDGRKLHFNGTCAADGTFSVDVVANVTYQVGAMHDKVRAVRGSRADVVAGTKDVEIVLPDFGRIHVRAIDAETGELARLIQGQTHFAVSWRVSGAGRFRAYHGVRATSSDMTLELPTGSIDLAVNLQKEGYVPWRLDGYRLAAGTTQELEARLARGVEARIQLVAHAGESAPRSRGHLIFCLEESQLALVEGPFPEGDDRSNTRINGIRIALQDTALMNQMLSIDESGIAFLHGLAPGKYSLRAFPPDFDIEPAFVTVTPGAKADLQFRWRSRE